MGVFKFVLETLALIWIGLIAAEMTPRDSGRPVGRVSPHWRRWRETDGRLAFLTGGQDRNFSCQAPPPRSFLSLFSLLRTFPPFDSFILTSPMLLSIFPADAF